MPRKTEEAERPAPASVPEPTLKSARELNGCDRLLTPKEAAIFLRVSTSWLAKARMRGDGPPFVKIGRSVRYAESALLRWMKVHQRLSTSEH
jgi:predicted DNA-binding transcriptional regulator AlpA